VPGSALRVYVGLLGQLGCDPRRGALYAAHREPKRTPRQPELKVVWKQDGVCGRFPGRTSAIR
jgi:hypothetical protein